jgi:nucleotide-binding universal stress UspA family protein
MGDRARRVLAPVNGGPGDVRLIETLAAMCQVFKPKFTLVYVVEVPQAMPIDAELPVELARGEAVLGAAETSLKKRIGDKGGEVLTELLQARSVGAAIVDEAIEQRAETVVMATENRVTHGKVSYGDSVKYVMMNCPCEVLLLRLALDDDGEE